MNYQTILKKLKARLARLDWGYIIALLLTSSITISFIIWFINELRADRQLEQELAEVGIPAQAIVQDCTKRIRTDCRITYQYEVSSSDKPSYTVEQRDPGCTKCNSHSIGSQITIRYLPQDPAIARVEGFNSYGGDNLIYILAISVVISGGGYLILYLISIIVGLSIKLGKIVIKRIPNKLRLNIKKGKWAPDSFSFFSVVVYTVALGIIAYTIWGEWQYMNQLLEEGISTEALVEGCYCCYSSGSCRLQYQFETSLDDKAERTLITNSESMKCDKCRQLGQAGTVRVRYLPQDPTEARFEDWEQIRRKINSFIIIFSGSTFFFGFLIYRYNVQSIS